MKNNDVKFTLPMLESPRPRKTFVSSCRRQVRGVFSCHL